MPRRLALPAALLLAAVAAVPAAAATPAREDFTFTYAFDAPAGQICDFAYHEEGTGTGWDQVFVDTQGNYVRDTAHVASTITHVNLDTGYTLTESLIGAQTFTDRTNSFRGVGMSWLLKDSSGRVVRAGAGLVYINFDTEEVRFTPNLGFDGRTVICPALGGNPA